MRTLLGAFLSLVLLAVASMDAAHALPHGPALEAQSEGMPQHEHGTAEIACCDGLSARGAPCLGDVVAATLEAPEMAAALQTLHLKPAAPISALAYRPQPPTGPPKA
ncbi:hypothetical protein [Roseivivax sp. THAF40]|uniref:hypothetical protein n=1 Tax=Roseivivax sp. THAF40 TaxID=2587858 RepID=UPI00126836EE|nr:hypothetical protein [Roseivivax sp. THAF40]